MSSSKNYNSIVFLTTLSVYLGLVLVGATPSVAAHQAALTPRFEIQNEIEIEDDLDKNPDEDLLALEISNLVSELNKFSEKGLFDWNSTNKFHIESLRICQSDNSPSFMGSGSVNQKIAETLEKTAVKIARRLFSEIARSGSGDLHSQTAGFELVLNNKTFVLTTEINPNNHVSDKQNGQAFVNELTGYLTRISSSVNPTKVRVVAENTKITFENDQIFIVTNLPRAAIDKLLAEKVAK